MGERVLGRTGLVVNEIGMGGIPIINVPFKRAVKVVRRAYEMGVNYFDTARAYRDSEAKMGEALREVRQEVYIATKGHSYQNAPSAKEAGKMAQEDLETSLRELKTDYVDVWQVHDVSTRRRWELTVGPGGVLEVIKRAQERGYVRFIGMSSHNLEVLKEAVESDLFDVILLVYNLAINDTAEVIRRAKERNIGVAVMKPHSGGIFFSQQRGGERITPWISWWFVLSNPDISVYLCGARRVKDLQDALRASRRFERVGPMPEEEAAKWVAIAKGYGEDVCRACQYCTLHCPEGIQVHVVMQLLDHARAFPYEWPKHRSIYQSLGKNFEDCTKCRRCERACPFNLPILQRFEEAHKRFTGEV